MTHEQVIELGKQFGVGRILWRSELRSIAAFLQPGEQILFMWSGGLGVTPLHATREKRQSSGVGFISNTRAMHHILSDIEEFPLHEIHNITRVNNDLHFNTATKRVRFRGTSDMLQRRLTEAVAGAGSSNTATPAFADNAPQVAVTCQSCAAHAMVPQGGAVSCAYCGSALHAPAPEPVTTVTMQPTFSQPPPQRSVGGEIAGGLLGGVLGGILEAVVMSLFKEGATYVRIRGTDAKTWHCKNTLSCRTENNF